MSTTERSKEEIDAAVLALELKDLLKLPDHLRTLSIEFGGAAPWAVVRCSFNLYCDADINRKVYNAFAKYKLVRDDQELSDDVTVTDGTPER
jgi:hypothetical protein